jgi:hypothetical protein
MKGQGGAVRKGILPLIGLGQDPRLLLYDHQLMNLLLEKVLMGAAPGVFKEDVAFANAQTPRVFLEMIAAGGMESISLAVHRQLPRIGSALQTACAPGRG